MPDYQFQAKDFCKYPSISQAVKLLIEGHVTPDFIDTKARYGKYHEGMSAEDWDLGFAYLSSVKIALEKHRPPMEHLDEIAKEIVGSLDEYEYEVGSIKQEIENGIMDSLREKLIEDCKSAIDAMQKKLEGMSDPSGADYTKLKAEFDDACILLATLEPANEQESERREFGEYFDDLISEKGGELNRVSGLPMSVLFSDNPTLLKASRTSLIPTKDQIKIIKEYKEALKDKNPAKYHRLELLIAKYNPLYKSEAVSGQQEKKDSKTIIGDFAAQHKRFSEKHPDSKLTFLEKAYIFINKFFGSAIGYSSVNVLKAGMDTHVQHIQEVSGAKLETLFPESHSTRQSWMAAPDAPKEQKPGKEKEGEKKKEETPAAPIPTM